MERAAGAAGSRREVMASLWRQGRGEADRSPWSKSNPAAPDSLVRPQTALPARPIVFLPEGSVTPSVASEIRLPEIEPPAVIPHKPVEEVTAVETQRPPADLEVKSRAKCAVFDPLRLYVNTFKRRSEEIHKAPAKAGGETCGNSFSGFGGRAQVVSRCFENGHGICLTVLNPRSESECSNLETDRRLHVLGVHMHNAAGHLTEVFVVNLT